MEQSGLMFAEYLVVASLGNNTATITLGIWRRHSDFSRLAHKASKPAITANTLLNTLLNTERNSTQ